MTDPQSRFELPPLLEKSDGTPRRVGFELEFSGITLDGTLEALRSSLGGDLQSESAAERVLRVEALGTFTIELDWAYLKRIAADDDPEQDGGEWIGGLSRAAALLVPVEVVCPPIPLPKLGVLEPMVASLRSAGAVGTDESLVAAYGVHINTEIPRLDAETLDAYLKAFALLQWWLVDAHDVDVARKVSPYIDLYPEAYVKQLLSRSEPTLDDLLGDYLAHNATRNRALDLLPLLAESDEQRVRRTVDDPRIKPRPAFHYRLPDCHIERPDWSLSGPWNTWLVVERLAYRGNELSELGAAFLDASRPILGVNRRDWVIFVDEWLTDRELA
jgi:hypothetical protein